MRECMQASFTGPYSAACRSKVLCSEQGGRCSAATRTNLRGLPLPSSGAAARDRRCPNTHDLPSPAVTGAGSARAALERRCVASVWTLWNIFEARRNPRICSFACCRTEVRFANRQRPKRVVRSKFRPLTATSGDGRLYAGSPTSSASGNSGSPPGLISEVMARGFRAE